MLLGRYRLEGRYDRLFLTGILLAVVQEFSQKISGTSFPVIVGLKHQNKKQAV